MEHYCRHLYRQLKSRLKPYNDASGPCASQVEDRFALAVQFWKQLSEVVKDHRFRSEEAEIFFFKWWKPKFTCHIEYSQLIYHTLFFQPAQPAPRILFWQKENKRLHRFKKDHPFFLRCLQDKNQEGNAWFFLRKHYQPATVPNALIYQSQPSVSANGDAPAALFMALAQYQYYVSKRLSR